MPKSFDRTTLILIALLMLAAIIARVLPGPRTIDDAFITFRYSRNLVEGQGFVYNYGVRTLGTTTPLFTLLLAGISLGTGQQDFQWYAIALSALADALNCALLFLITRRATGSQMLGIVLGALWALAPRSVTFAIGGMETSPNILWMLAAVWCYLSAAENPPAAGIRGWLADKIVWMGVFAGLGLWTRIDAALWVAPLFAYHWWEHLRAAQKHDGRSYLPLRAWLACLLTFAPWLLFSTLYFGSPLPNSINAKSLAYVMPSGAAFVELALRNYAFPFFEVQLLPESWRTVGGLFFMTLYLLLALLGLLYSARNAPRLLPFLLYPWLYLAAFSLANPLIFRWYTLPPLPALTLGLVCGLWSIIGAEKINRAAPIVASAFGVFWLAASLNVWTLHPDHGPDRPAPQMAWHQIELYYERIGRQLREDYGVTPQTRVASADIGAIGYFSRATIVDTVGLVTPELRRYYPNAPEWIVAGQNYAVPPQLILDTQPDYFVTMEAFVRLGLEQNATFTASYMLLEEIPTNFYGTGMRLYGRRGEQP
ncbi:MAG: hypothetical protein HXY40_17940 [Chloroflexi bacterium]|nr:hypothetical protein [Chloroflexota bacterium]